MAFGQVAGPPAGARQLEQLGALLADAGYASFKEARHPFGLTQRQAAGKFTVGEADELIERLEAAAIVADATGADDVEPAPSPPARTRTPAADRRTARRAGSAAGAASAATGGSGAASGNERLAQQLTKVPQELIVAELERRGWCCIPPIADGPADPGLADPRLGDPGPAA
jgi:hypothetical protein